MATLNKLIWLQKIINNARINFYNRFWGMNIHSTARISLTAKLDRTYPKGMHIKEYSYITFGVAILSHDRTRGVYRDTVVEKNCFIGCKSIIMPGVKVGPNSIVAAGAVVTKDVPPNCIAAGNPAQIIKTGIEVGRYGRFLSADSAKTVVNEQR